MFPWHPNESHGSKNKTFYMLFCKVFCVFVCFLPNHSANQKMYNTYTLKIFKISRFYTWLKNILFKNSIIVGICHFYCDYYYTLINLKNSKCRKTLIFRNMIQNWIIGCLLINFWQLLTPNKGMFYNNSNSGNVVWFGMICFYGKKVTYRAFFLHIFFQKIQISL